MPYRGPYSYEVRNAVAHSLIRDRLPYRLVQQRMADDYRLLLSLGFIHACFQWAHAQIDTEVHRQFVQTHFSGVLCIDEVHEGEKTILFAQLFPLPNGVVYFQRVTRFFAEGVRKLFASAALTADLVGGFGSLA